MKIEVRYYTRSGNTKKLAEAVAEAVGAEAKTTGEPLTEDVDILFLGSSVYAYGVDDNDIRSCDTMQNDEYSCLKLENQLCFPLYACSKEVIRRYKPYLDKLDLTYTQYIAMMVLWEKKAVTVKELGKSLYLDSGTLTPLLKKLEEKNYVVRNRSKEDERSLIVSITKAGEDLKEQAVKIPMELGACVNVEPQEAQQLQKLLYKLLNGLS